MISYVRQGFFVSLLALLVSCGKTAGTLTPPLESVIRDTGAKLAAESVTGTVTESEVESIITESKVEITGSSRQKANEKDLSASLSGTVPPELKSRQELFFATATATSELVQENTSIYNGAMCAVDGDVVTSWQEGEPGDGIGETITVGFQMPQRVDYLEFNAGNWRDENQWNRNLKPKGLEITVNGTKFDVELQNVRASQYVVFSEPIETTTFVIKITDVYGGAEGESDVPISEIRAFGEAVGKNDRVISDTQPTPTDSTVPDQKGSSSSQGTASGSYSGSQRRSSGHSPGQEQWYYGNQAAQFVLRYIGTYLTSESGKSAVTIYEEDDGYMFGYINISGVNPSDGYDIYDGEIVGDTVYLYMKNLQGQYIVATGNRITGTIEFGGIIYR